MTKKQYAAYLQSKYWRNLRDEILKEQTECERCKLPRWLAGLVYDQDLHVHHKSYANLGHEEVEDLEVLCRRCHELETFKRSDLPAVPNAHCALCGSVHWDRRADLCPTCFSVFETPYLVHISNSARPRIDGENTPDYVLRMLLFDPYPDNVRERAKEFRRIITEEARRLEKIFSADAIPF